MKKISVLWIFTLWTSFQMYGERGGGQMPIETPSSPQLPASDVAVDFPHPALEQQDMVYDFVSIATEEGKKAWKKRRKKLKSYQQVGESLQWIKTTIQKKLQNDFSQFEAQTDFSDNPDSQGHLYFFVNYLNYQLVQKSLDVSFAKTWESVNPEAESFYKAYKDFWTNFSSLISEIPFYGIDEGRIEGQVRAYFEYFRQDFMSQVDIQGQEVSDWYRLIKLSPEPSSCVLTDGDPEILEEFINRLKACL